MFCSDKNIGCTIPRCMWETTISVSKRQAPQKIKETTIETSFCCDFFVVMWQKIKSRNCEESFSTLHLGSWWLWSKIDISSDYLPKKIRNTAIFGAKIFLKTFEFSSGSNSKFFCFHDVLLITKNSKDAFLTFSYDQTLLYRITGAVLEFWQSDLHFSLFLNSRFSKFALTNV